MLKYSTPLLQGHISHQHFLSHFRKIYATTEFICLAKIASYSFLYLCFITHYTKQIKVNIKCLKFHVRRV